MRYLLLNSLKAGGAERVAQSLATTGLFDGVILLEEDSDLKVNLPVSFLSNHTSKTGRIFKTLFIPMYAWRMGRLIKKNDIVVSFAERANFTNVLSQFINGNKAVLTLHINLAAAFKNKLKFLYYFLIKALYPWASAIVPVSRGINMGLDSTIYYQGIQKVIYNPLDLETIRQESAAQLDPKWSFLIKNQVIINVGRLTVQKGQWNLLRIFKGLLERKPGMKLLILGDGELYDRLKDYGSHLGLRVFDSRRSSEPDETFDVFMLGYQENPYKFYSRSQIFVLSSLYEGLPMAIIEAMACGLPVVSGDCNFGPREILFPGSPLNQTLSYPKQTSYGVLMPVPLGSLENRGGQETDGVWIEILSSLLNNETQRKTLSALSLRRAQDFSLQKIKEQWLELFKAIEK